MKSLREIVESSPGMRAVAMRSLRMEDKAEALGPPRWDWQSIQRLLVVRLRSIGDTVLTTPSLVALRRFLPEVQIDILLENWVAPVLEGFPHINTVIPIERRSTASRARVARQIRAAGYDVVYNLHGGTTATLLTRATGATHRVGYAHYQYSRLHNHLAPSSAELWGKAKTHSVEQQLALVGWTGIPVSDRPATQLAITDTAMAAVAGKLQTSGIEDETPFAVVHPAAAFDTKRWAIEKYARVVEHLAVQGLATIAITTPGETALVKSLAKHSATPVTALTDLSLPEVTALLSRARLFVGNDSGIAHIAAAVSAPVVVIFGSSNVTHWAPWSSAPAETVSEELECQPCPGYFCAEFEQPECIRRVPVERVTAAIDRVLKESF